MKGIYHVQRRGWDIKSYRAWSLWDAMMVTGTKISNSLEVGIGCGRASDLELWMMYFPTWMSIGSERIKGDRISGL